MARDPFDILGIARDATLAEAGAAYRRLAQLFHPDRLRDARRDVRAEGERMLREATDAIRDIRSRFGRPLSATGHEHDPPADEAARQRWLGEPAMPVRSNQPDPGPNHLAPSDAATDAEARLFEAELRAVGNGDALHVRWHGEHAAAVLAALRRAHRVDGPIRQVEWGTYEVVLDGAATRRFLCAVASETDGGGWQHDPVELLGGDRLLPARRGQHNGVHLRLGDLLDLLDNHATYSVLADVY